MKAKKSTGGEEKGKFDRQLITKGQGGKATAKEKTGAGEKKTLSIGCPAPGPLQLTLAFSPIAIPLSFSSEDFWYHGKRTKSETTKNKGVAG